MTFAYLGWRAPFRSKNHLTKPQIPHIRGARFSCQPGLSKSLPKYIAYSWCPYFLPEVKRNPYCSRYHALQIKSPQTPKMELPWMPLP